MKIQIPNEAIVTAEQKQAEADANASEARRVAYTQESDALAFKFLAKLAQSSNLPEAKAWLDARNGVKERLK